MVDLRKQPSFTVEYDQSAFSVPSGCCYVFGKTSEERSLHVENLVARTTDVLFVEIQEHGRSRFEVIGSAGVSVGLRRRDELERFLKSATGRPIFLDMTGLSHHVWAPIVKVAIETDVPINVVYVEPHEYTRHNDPTQDEIFDLSERIEGIAPLPQFVRLSDDVDGAFCFVPILGFEGTRFAHMLVEVEPPTDGIFPIVGAPGFRAEYPFFAYLGNASTLDRVKGHRRVQYAQSNCPFRLFYLLEQLASINPGKLIKIGLIGTKPHALGAVLYTILGGSKIELVYDYVRRKKKRTSGAVNCLVYSVSAFMDRRSAP